MNTYQVLMTIFTSMSLIISLLSLIFKFIQILKDDNVKK